MQWTIVVLTPVSQSEEFELGQLIPLLESLGQVGEVFFSLFEWLYESLFLTFQLPLVTFQSDYDAQWQRQL